MQTLDFTCDSRPRLSCSEFTITFYFLLFQIKIKMGRNFEMGSSGKKYSKYTNKAKKVVNKGFF